jgi:hypothetical protein
MFVKIAENEWINLDVMERIWVDAKGHGRMITPDGTNYKITDMRAYSDEAIVKEIQRAMTIRQNQAGAKE